MHFPLALASPWRTFHVNIPTLPTTSNSRAISIKLGIACSIPQSHPAVYLSLTIPCEPQFVLPPIPNSLADIPSFSPHVIPWASLPVADVDAAQYQIRPPPRQPWTCRLLAILPWTVYASIHCMDEAYAACSSMGEIPRRVRHRRSGREAGRGL